jgi:hypothetical protein
MKTVVRTDERILSSDIFDRDSRVKRPDHGTWAEPGKNIPVYHRCGVLVVGGGPRAPRPRQPQPARAPTWRCSSATTTWAACRPAAW